MAPEINIIKWINIEPKLELPTISIIPCITPHKITIQVTILSMLLLVLLQ